MLTSVILKNLLLKSIADVEDAEKRSSILFCLKEYEVALRGEHVDAMAKHIALTDKQSKDREKNPCEDEKFSSACSGYISRCS